MDYSFKATKRQIYPEVHVDNFRDILNYTTLHFPNKIAFCYKSNPSLHDFNKVTYKQHYYDVKNLATMLLKFGLKGEKVALIGHNKYGWPVSYMAINTGGMICVPFDYLLPENEIENLLIRCKAKAVIFDDKFLDIFKSIKSRKKTNLDILICMDDVKEEGIFVLNNLLEEGKRLRKKGNRDYEKIKIDSDKMSVIIFTSGTTDISKAVMLSQRNICSNVSGMTSLLRYNEGESVLSCLPLNHTFECTATYLSCSFMGFTVCFCEYLKNIQKDMKDYEVAGFLCVPAILDIMYRKILKSIEKKRKNKESKKRNYYF